MASLMPQSLVTYVEEENVPALKALLEKCKDVDERNEVREMFKDFDNCIFIITQNLHLVQ